MNRCLRRYILTGAPGSGKTSILRVLAGRPGHAVVEEAATDVIAHEQARGKDEPWRNAGIYERHVFFGSPLGFIGSTAARITSFDDSLAFERLHQEVYLALGYEFVDVPAAEARVRAEVVAAHITSWA